MILHELHRLIVADKFMRDAVRDKQWCPVSEEVMGAIEDGDADYDIHSEIITPTQRGLDRAMNAMHRDPDDLEPA